MWISFVRLSAFIPSKTSCVMIYSSQHSTCMSSISPWNSSAEYCRKSKGWQHGKKQLKWLTAFNLSLLLSWATSRLLGAVGHNPRGSWMVLTTVFLGPLWNVKVYLLGRADANMCFRNKEAWLWFPSPGMGSSVPNPTPSCLNQKDGEYVRNNESKWQSSCERQT